MILLDANALLSLLLAQPAAPQVAELLRTGHCGMPAPCLAEVIDQSMRRHGGSQQQLLERVRPLFEEPVVVIPTDLEVAQRAGEIRAAHYERDAMPISLADSMLLACAEPGDEIASADAAVLEVADRLGIETITLPDSSGRRPAID